MKNRYFFILLTALLSIYFTLFLPGCSTTDESDDFQLYELDVIIGEGVSGTPVQGTYSYEEGDTVDYSYVLLDSYRDLTVTLDGEEVEASGTVTITGVHTLRANADPVYVISGDWNLSEEYDDGSTFEVTATFAGSQESGTVSDSDGGAGVYAVDENNAVEFNLEFDNINYEYEGSFDDANTITGTCKKVANSGTSYGTWSATRVEETSSIKSKSPSEKKIRKGKKKN